MLERFDTQFWSDVVWTLLHSVWQAAIIALLLGFVLTQIPAKKASLRYGLAVGAILTLVFVSFLTYHVRAEFRDYVPLATTELASDFKVNLGATPTPSVETSHSKTGSEFSFNIGWTSFAALFWLIGVATMVLRTVIAVIKVHHQSAITPIESKEQLALLRAQSEKIGLRRVPSFWSSMAGRTPYAVGVLSPAIVVPMSMLTNLNAMELQAVLAHELAHIRRNDYLANLFQMVIEAVYFFNPAVWWISRQIRVEREACCDQVAIELTSNQIGYATILVDWMESVAEGTGPIAHDTSPPALAFADRRPSGMLERIQRILKPDAKPHLRVSLVNWVFVLGASLLMACVMNVGSKAATVVASQVLQHADRVEEIKSKQADVKVPNSVFEEGKSEIRLRIVAEDGGEVEVLKIFTTIKNGPITSSRSTSVVKEGAEHLLEVNSGQVTVGVYSKNYAPAIIGPVEAYKDQSLTHDVKLIKGQPHLVHVVDEYEEPIENAKLSMGPKAVASAIYKVAMSDANGEASVEHRRPGGKSQLVVEKSGYQLQRVNVINNIKTEVVLKAAPLSKGVVLSASGDPVADAEVIILSAQDPLNHHHHGRQLAATTDKHGRFETSLFAPAARYMILVVSDVGLGLVEGVTARDGLEFQLQPPCCIDVTLKGDLERLRRKKNGELYIRFTQTVGGHLRQGDVGNRSIEIVEDSERVIRLKLSRLTAGEFTLVSGSFEHRGEAKPSNHALEIVAQSKDFEPRTRVAQKMGELQVKFKCNGQFVKPGGFIHSNFELARFHPVVEGVVTASLKRGSYYLSPERLIGFTFENLHNIVVEPEKTKELIIDVQPAGAVSGLLVDSNGKPISRPVSCRYRFRKGSGITTAGLHDNFTSDSDGNFLLTPIPLGAEVIVRSGDRFNPAISKKVLVEVDNPVAEVKLKTASPSKAMVRVVDDQDNPIQGIGLSVVLVGRKEHRFSSGSVTSWSGSLLTDANGEAELTPLHPTWEYSVTANARTGFVKDTAELVQGKTAVIQLKTGQVIKGKLIDKDGNPVSNREITAKIDDDRYSYRRIRADHNTDSNGRFEFTRLPQGLLQIGTFGADDVLVDAGTDKDPIQLQLNE